MKYFLIILFSSLTIVGFAQNENPFSHLKTIEVDSLMGVKFHYPSSGVDIRNISCRDLDNDHFLAQNETEIYEGSTYIGSFFSSQLDFLIHIVYSPGLSADPSFRFYTQNEKIIFRSKGINLYMPTTDRFYIDGYTNNVFSQKRKFEITKTGIQEITQPYYSIGLKTKTNCALTLYADTSLNSVVAKIPDNYDIEVVLSEYKDFSQLYLIKTKFGLMGWVYLEDLYNKPCIEGLRLIGD